MLIYWYLFSDLGFADDTLKITGPQGVTLPFQWKVEWSGTAALTPITNIIKESIKYVGVFSMLGVSYGGIHFLTSYGSDEKVKKAKSTVLYSLLGVIISITAYTLVDIVNSLNIGGPK